MEIGNVPAETYKYIVCTKMALVMSSLSILSVFIVPICYIFCNGILFCSFCRKDVSFSFYSTEHNCELEMYSETFFFLWFSNGHSCVISPEKVIARISLSLPVSPFSYLSSLSSSLNKFNPHGKKIKKGFPFFVSLCRPFLRKFFISYYLFSLHTYRNDIHLGVKKKQIHT